MIERRLEVKRLLLYKDYREESGMTKESIKSKVLQDEEKIRRFDIKSLALFGSYARGDERDESDIDFLVEFEKPTFRNYIGLLAELEDLFQKKVDLVCKDGLRERIRPFILSEAEPVL
jgi:uncharacterized protein